MPASALALLLVSTLTHTAWNAWVKGSRAKLSFLWLGLLAAIFIYALPVALTTPLAVPASAWRVLLLSAVFETGYLISITRAYTVGDLSLVYPVARGSAPLIIALASAALLSERLPAAGYAAIGLLTVGIYFVSLVGWRDFTRPLKAILTPAALWALLAGLFIAGYSTVDKVGVGLMSPSAYNLWVFIAMTILGLPVVLWLDGRALLMRTARTEWRQVLAGGVFVMGTYFMVLWALSMAPASYVGAVRGVSVLLGAVWGWRFLGERLGATRVIGACLMFAGLVALALGG
ncbi:MAG: DMT family transporter [Anaerolineae bacterium]